MKRFLLSGIAALSTLSAQQCEPDDPNAPDLFLKCVQRFSVHTELLYWTVSEGALDYALKMRHPASGPSPTYAQGKYELAQYGLDPGFRAALVFYRAPHYWEVKWQYTRIGVSGRDRKTKPSADQDFLTGTWPQLTPAPLANIKSNIHLNYNVFEMTADRVFIPNPHLRLRYIGGVTAVWMNQDWKIQYRDAIDRGTTIRNRWDFGGLGLKTGTMIDWFMGCTNIYLTGTGTFGLLVGQYTNRAQQKANFQQTGEDNPAILVRDTHFRDMRFAFVAQGSVGPSWQKVYEQKKRVEVFVGFEVNSWFNLQEVYRSTAGSAFTAKETWINTSVMTLMGLTSRLTVDF